MMRCSTVAQASIAMSVMGVRGRDHDVYFYGASSFNSDVSSWDVSRVETMG